MKIAPPNRAVVATAHSPEGLRAARRLGPSQADLVEIRADALAGSPDAVARALPAIRLPVILTVRDPAEGGSGNLSAADRLALFERFLPGADWLDIELRNARRFAPLIARARAGSKRVILSHHDFHAVPSPVRCAALLRRAADAGADLFKLAATPTRPDDLCPRLRLLSAKTAIPVAAMSMGPLGKSARLLLSACGSALTYGYLHRPIASGQWDAATLKRRLAEAVS